MTKRLVLIDGHAILHRAFHAFPTTLTTRKGELVNAVYGFTRILLKVIDDYQPEYLAVAFDVAQPNFRHEAFIGYQADRPHMDQQLKDQIARVKEVVTAMNIPIFTAPGFEADDVIGTLARQASNQPRVKRNQVIEEVYIVTGDRDLLQLVDKKTRLVMPGRNVTEPIVYDQAKVKEVVGVETKQIIDYKALIGDSSDNYPGVPGIGPKTAVRLLEKYGTLDKIYNHLGELEPKTAQKLSEGKDSAYLSKKLATIVLDVPVSLQVAECCVADYELAKVATLFEELEFKSLIKRLPGYQEPEVKKASQQQTKLF